MNITELLKSTAFRLATAFAAAFSFAIIVLFLLLYWQAGRDLEQRLATHLTEEIDALLAIDRHEGFNELAADVISLSSTPSNADSIYSLTGATGEFVAGNVRLMPQFAGTLSIPRAGLPAVAARGHPEDQFLSRWTTMTGGNLLVGLSDRDVRDTRSFLLADLGWTLLATLVTTALTGWLLAMRSNRRINQIDQTLAAVAEGRIDERVPLAGTGDDLDRISSRLNTTFDRLSQLIIRVNESSTDIAHDLKTPLGRLRQKLETALSRMSEHSESRPLIEQAIGEADGIVETFEGILRISQIEAGARKSRFAAVDLSAIAGRVADAYEAVVEDNGKRLAIGSGLGRPALVLGDADLLTQMLANLIENAIRHCPEGTLISIDLLPGPVLTIADTGPGIPEAERDKVFTRLYRLEKSRTTEGNGLGLSLVKAIVDLHDAKITLGDNNPGLLVTIMFQPTTSKRTKA